jgi:anti-sigma factor RsiW
MGNIVSLRDASHDEIETLLPWFVSGGLEAGEAALVEAHLAGCAECRALV